MICKSHHKLISLQIEVPKNIELNFNHGIYHESKEMCIKDLVIVHYEIDILKGERIGILVLNLLTEQVI